MVSIGIIGALIAGILSLISPCSALLLPAFFAYAFSSLKELTGRTLVFLAGLATVLVPIGTGLAGIGQVVTTHRGSIIAIAGWIIIALGIYTFFGGGFSIPGLSRLNSRVKGSGWVSVYLLGAVYGFAGFCAGPMLGAVLTTAAVSGSAFYGGAIMFSYAVGMAVPLFILALLWDRFDLGNKAWLRGKTLTVGPVTTNTLSMVAGGLFIIIGALFLTSHGTAGLPTLLDIDAQFAIQEWAHNISRPISDAWALFGLSLLATFVAAYKAGRTKVATADAGAAD